MKTGKVGEVNDLRHYARERLEAFFKDIPEGRVYTLHMELRLDKMKGPQARCKCGRPAHVGPCGISIGRAARG